MRSRLATLHPHRYGFTAARSFSHQLHVWLVGQKPSDSVPQQGMVDQFRKHLPDVALLDLQMPEMNALMRYSPFVTSFPMLELSS